MAKELYVGSLSYDTTEWELEKLFSVSGRVTSIHLITDSKTGQFKGCGYVRMSTEAEAKDAIASLDGALFLDKKIHVSMANPQKQAQQGGYKGKSGGGARGGAGAPRATGSRPAGARAAGSTAAGARATGTRSAGSAAAGDRTSGAGKPAAAKKAFSKPASSKPASSKPAASKKRP